MPIITLTTDFGTKDAYVGQVKGVILARCPEATLVDLTHRIPPQAVTQAALSLASSVPHFPTGTIHLAVVDPGVGTNRRPIMAQAGGNLFVAPDNGLLTLILDAHPQAQVRVITNQQYMNERISPTFHGRDLFGPVVGHLAAGLDPARLGDPIDNPVRLDLEPPVLKSGRITGRVVMVDRFGNLITNIPVEMILAPHSNRAPVFHVAGQTLSGLHLTYAEAEPGNPLALIGSFDLLEIALNQGRADDFFGLSVNDPVEVEL